MDTRGRTRQADPGGTPGHTLLEVAAGVGALAVLIGLAVPIYTGNLAGRDLQRAAFLLLNDLRVAQQAAVAQSGDGPRVEICLRPGGYEIYRVLFSDPVNRTGAAPEEAGGQPVRIKVASAGQEYGGGVTLAPAPDTSVFPACLIDGNRFALWFAASGSPYPAPGSEDGVIRSVRFSRGSQTVHVDVEPGTGLARVRR